MKELVAYRAWKCRFCPEVRQDASDMWDHLMDKHEVGSVENDRDGMYREKKELDKADVSN